MAPPRSTSKDVEANDAKFYGRSSDGRESGGGSGLRRVVTGVAVFTMATVGVTIGTVGMRHSMVLDAQGGKSSMTTTNRAMQQLAAADKITQKPLAVNTRNEYGLRKADDFYLPFLRGRDDATSAILIEPYRDTTLVIPEESICSACSYSWEFSSDDVAITKVRSPQVMLYTTGKGHLTLREFHDKTPTVVRRSRTFDVYVKYVRRELRQLTDHDRTDFMNAASTMWSTSTLEGRKLYGDRYYDINYLAIVHNDLAGNMACDFIHGDLGYAFLNSHSSLNMMLEQSVQAINPRLSLPYWDYTLDAAKLTSKYQTPDGVVKNDGNLLRIWRSNVFSADYFGTPNSESGVIQDGRWTDVEAPKMTDELVANAGISGHFKTKGFGSCHGQDASVCDKPTLDLLEMVGSSTAHQKNSYGLLRAPWNMLENPKITRRSEVCGAANNAQFPDCVAVYDCYKMYTSFKDYIVNLQLSPHGTVHIFTGGAFGECAETFPSLESVLSDSDEAVKVYEEVTYKIADIQKDMWASGVKSCPTEAECSVALAAGGTCACSCSALNSTWLEKDADEMRSSDLWKWTSFAASIDTMDSTLSREQLAAITKVSCNTDTLTGDMVGSNSPLDITFFSTHGEVERMFQRKMVSGTMTDMSWPKAAESTCPGQKADWRNLWFDYTFSTPASGVTLDSTALTNQELLMILNPNSKLHEDYLPYVYGNLEWAHCQIADEEVSSPFLSDDWIWEKTSADSASEEEEEFEPSKSVQHGVQQTPGLCDSSYGPVLDGVDFVDLHKRNIAAASSTLDEDTQMSSYEDASTPPAIGSSAPRQGLDSISATFGGYTFWFLSKENRAAFELDPASYVPRYGGYDAFSLAEGAYDASGEGVSMPSVRIVAKGDYEFTRKLRPTFYKSSKAREKMLTCGDDCFRTAEEHYESIAEGMHCFNTAHVEL
jgi:hypothetical protein